MDDIAIIGVGLHPWGKFPEKFWTNMASDAIYAALDDAGITWKDIQIVVSGSQNWGGRKGIYAGSYIDEVMGYTGVPTMNIKTPAPRRHRHRRGGRPGRLRSGGRGARRRRRTVAEGLLPLPAAL